MTSRTAAGSRPRRSAAPIWPAARIRWSTACRPRCRSSRWVGPPTVSTPRSSSSGPWIPVAMPDRPSSSSSLLMAYRCVRTCPSSVRNASAVVIVDRGEPRERLGEEALETLVVIGGQEHLATRTGVQRETLSHPRLRAQLGRCVDLGDDVQTGVRPDDTEGHGLPDGGDQIADDRPGHLAQEQLLVGVAGEAQQLRPQQHAVVAGDPQEEALLLERLDHPQRRRPRQPGRPGQRRDVRVAVVGRGAQESDRLPHRLIQLGSLGRRHAATIASTHRDRWALTRLMYQVTKASTSPSTSEYGPGS